MCHSRVTSTVINYYFTMEEEHDIAPLTGDGSESGQGTTKADDNQSVHLPAYLAYLSLGFKVITTVVIILMASWVIITIKTSRSLRKPHNIFVTHLMVLGIMQISTITLLSGAMVIGCFTGVGDFISCSVFSFMFYPSGVMYFTFLVMSIDKVIAITFPLRHSDIMKPRVVRGIIVAKHILAIMFYSKNLFNATSFTKVAQFGICTRNDSAVLENLLTLIIPMLLTCLIRVFLDVFLTIKAYQIHKKIQEESKLSGGHHRDNDQLKALKKKEGNVKKHLKPMITLMVVMMGNSFFALMFPVLYVPATLMESPAIYESVVRYVVLPNLSYVPFLLQPFIYGLYFKQVREPMIRLLKSITCPCKCKSAAVAPQQQRNRITWLNPN